MRKIEKNIKVNNLTRAYHMMKKYQESDVPDEEPLPIARTPVTPIEELEIARTPKTSVGKIVTPPAQVLPADPASGQTIDVQPSQELLTRDKNFF